VTKPPLLQRICREFLVFEWFWLLLILPAVAFPNPLRSLALLAIPIVLMARKIGYGHFLPPTHMDLSLLLFYLMVLVGIIVSADMSFTISKAIGLVYGGLAFYAVVAGVRGMGRNLAAAVLLFFAGGTGAASLGLLTVRWPSLKLPILQSIAIRLPQRLIDLPGAPEGVSPNQIAGTLLWVLPVSLALVLASVAWYGRLRPRFSGAQWGLVMAIVWGSAILQGTALVLTQSRSGLIGIVAAIMLVSILILWRFRWFVVMLAVTVAAGVVLVTINWGWRSTVDRLVDTGSEFLVSNMDDTVSTVEFRLAVWDRALQGISDFPFTGSGLGTFRQVQPVLYPFLNIRSEGDIGHAHNHWLQTAVDLGLPGLVAYLAIWMIGVSLIWRIGRGPDIWNRALAVGFAGSFLAYSVYGLMDAVALGAKPGFLWWMLLGLIVAVDQMSRSPERPGDPDPSRPTTKPADGFAIDL
jgi:putative inorganic carbon (hco3(-)) transporter